MFNQESEVNHVAMTFISPRRYFDAGRNSNLLPLDNDVFILKIFGAGLIYVSIKKKKHSQIQVAVVITLLAALDEKDIQPPHMS